MLRSELEEKISQARAELIDLEHELEALDRAESTDKCKYIGKWYIQDMYEYGTRIIHVHDILSDAFSDKVLVSGITWDEQSGVLAVLRSSSPEWLEDFTYGKLEEIQEDEVLEKTLDLVEKVVKFDLFDE